MANKPKATRRSRKNTPRPPGKINIVGSEGTAATVEVENDVDLEASENGENRSDAFLSNEKGQNVEKNPDSGDMEAVENDENPSDAFLPDENEQNIENNPPDSRALGSPSASKVPGATGAALAGGDEEIIELKTSRSLNHYSLEFKLKVVEQAKKSSNRNAGR